MKIGNVGAMMRRIYEPILMVLAVAGLALVAAYLVSSAREAQLYNVDVERARLMTHTIRDYLETAEHTHLTAADIRSLVRENHTFPFETTTTDTAFWYDINTQEVLVGPAFTGVERRAIPFTEEASSWETGVQLEELVAGYLLLDTGGSSVAEHLFKLRNLSGITAYWEAVSALTPHGLREHILNFSMAHTLYVNDFRSLGQIRAEKTTEHVIFADDVLVLSRAAIANVSSQLPEIVILPVSLQIIQTGALSNLSDHTRVLHAHPDQVHVEQGAFSDQDLRNTDWFERAGVIKLFDLEVFVVPTAETIRYYADINRTQYLGAIRVKPGEPTRYYDDEGGYVGSYDGIDYRNPEGDIIDNGLEFTNLMVLIAQFSTAQGQSRQYNQAIQFTLSEGQSLSEAEIHRVQTEYIFLNQHTIANVRGYDTFGALIAQGTTTLSPSIVEDGIHD